MGAHSSAVTKMTESGRNAPSGAGNGRDRRLEMNHLAGFLPELYEAFGNEQTAISSGW
jgi:hypothetical protein